MPLLRPALGFDGLRGLDPAPPRDLQNPRRRRTVMQQTVTEMLRAFPKAPMVEGDELAACIDACFDCAQSCLACADACLAEEHVSMLARCLRLNLDCPGVCHTT